MLAKAGCFQLRQPNGPDSSKADYAKHASVPINPISPISACLGADWERPHRPRRTLSVHRGGSAEGPTSVAVGHVAGLGADGCP